MAGSLPPGSTPGDAQEDLSGPSRWWWWLVVVGVAGLLVLLVVQPWTEHQTEPDASDTASSALDIPSSTPSDVLPAPTGEESSTTPPPPPGADADFTATSLATLFVTDADLTAAVPAAAPGVKPAFGPGELAWGLPDGSSVDPASCTTSVTVVSKAPDEFDARSSGNDAMVWEQRITVLKTADVAQEAFSDLAATVDTCPEYAQINPGMDGGRWAAQPAIEGPGVYPSIVQEVTATGEGTSIPEFHGHMLVGNAIVTWTASAIKPGDPTAALATLGDATSLDAMVQSRAQQAVVATS